MSEALMGMVLLLCKHQAAATAAAYEGTLETQLVYRPLVQNSRFSSQTSRKIPCSSLYQQRSVALASLFMLLQ